MEKLKMHSPDLTQDNIAKLAALFPNCVTEARDAQGKLKKAVDFDQLRQELSGSIVEGPQERYRLDWPGKREALLAANAPIAKTLRPCREESVDFDTTKNLFIEGDNLEALKVLQESYLGKIKIIYIDPPYNTGSDFIYEDDFFENIDDFLVQSLQRDEIGNNLVSNLESNGRFHSDWMSMMYSRLRLAKNLLSEDGVLLASIGPEEVKNLVGLLGEIFGEENRISILTWEKGRKNDSTFFSESVEYMLLFAKSKSFLAEKGKWREKKKDVDKILEHYSELRQRYGSNHATIEMGMRKFYSELKSDHPAKELEHFFRSDDRGLFFGADISSASTSIPDYEIIHPRTGKPVKKPSRGWGATEPVMIERIRNDEVLFGIDENTIPLKKSYLKEVDSIVRTPVFYKDGRGATGVLKTLFGDVIFNNPKDHSILADCIAYCLQGSKDAIVLDFFAGSGSTAHAVMELNAADAGTRQFIMIQIPELLDVKLATSPVAKQTTQRANKFLESIGKPNNIAEISKERLRRVSSAIYNDPLRKLSVDVGFRVFKIDQTNLEPVYYSSSELKQESLLAHIDNIRPGRTAEDLLFQVLLDWGVDLALPIQRETLAGKEVFFVDETALAACFEGGIEEEFVKALAKRKPIRVVFRDAGFADDAVKINVGEIFKSLSPETEVKVI